MIVVRPFARRLTTVCVSAAAVMAMGTPSSAEPKPPTCGSPGLALLASPMAPWKGAPLRVVFTAEEALTGELSLVSPNGTVAATSRERHGGPPYFWYAEVAAPSVGQWQAKLVREGASAECATVTRDIPVSRGSSSIGGGKKGVWPIRDSWTRGTENLYAAWIEKLFDAPLEEAPSWKALHEVLRDPARNVLFNHLSQREDSRGTVIKPDCADLPYFLRAYFAFKMGLPFGYTKCTRGGGGGPPKCYQWWNILNEEPAPDSEAAQSPAQAGFFGFLDQPVPPSKYKLPPKPPGLIPGFGYYLGTTVANSVHSGNGRTAADDNNTDYYPVPLSQDALRPGTVYADPYGHLLVISKRVAQTDGAAGVMLAVDGQPDGTVARKRFWRGNFLFAQDRALGSPGFKRFRPIALKGGSLRRLTNDEIAKNTEYSDFSLDQAKLGVEDFYDRMEDVMSPAPLDPARAMTEVITALEEQVNARVTSVENGRKWQVGGGKNATMPEGASIFETTGAWEDFATPSRDLRLLIAIDVVRGFPNRVSRRPERYAMPSGKSATDVQADLDRTLASEVSARKVAYTRSDGSEWKLTLKDVIDRVAALEMAYNLNDCVELRWGAADGSDEAATCSVRASPAQRSKMTEYRAWFSERRRPPRG